jgi:uncharacterized protein YbaP (TraB family)
MNRSLLSALMALSCAVALAGCGENPAQEADQSPPLPALWEVSSADGTVEGWLFGTIHSLPDGTTWETELLSDTIEDADVLIVEIADLENKAAISHIFARLARTDDLPPLSSRLPASEQAALREMMKAGSFSEGDFTATESWAAALMLAQGIRETAWTANCFAGFKAGQSASWRGQNASWAFLTASQKVTSAIC